MPSLSAELLPCSGDSDKYYVGNIIFNEQVHRVPGKKFVKLDAETALKVRDTISAGHDVLFTPSQIKNSHTLTVEDLEIIEKTGFEVEKQTEIFKIRNKITDTMAIMSVIDIYGFHSCYSKLLTKGYNITDDNREEKYLEIINTGDNDLLELLETYIELKDKIDLTSMKYMRLKKAIDNIEATTTSVQLKEVVANITA